MQSLPALTSSNLLFFCCLSRFSRSAFSFAARALLCFSSVSLCLKFSFSACCRAETEKMWGEEEKKERKHDGLLSGVNYNSAKPVKEGGSSQTLMKSLSGTTKVRWSFLAALWFKSSETKKKKKTNFISLNSETRLMRLMHQWSRNQEKLMITSNSVLWLWVVAT